MSDRALRDRLEALQLERRELETELTLQHSKTFVAKRQALLDESTAVDAELAPLTQQESSLHAELDGMKIENVRLRTEFRQAEEQSLPASLVALLPMLLLAIVWGLNQGLAPTALVVGGALLLGGLLAGRTRGTETDGAWAARELGPLLGAVVAMVGALFVAWGWKSSGVSADTLLSFRNSELVTHLAWTHLVQLALLFTVLTASVGSHRVPLLFAAGAAGFVALSWYDWVPPQHASFEPGAFDDEYVREAFEWRDPMAARWAVLVSNVVLSLVAVAAWFARRDEGRRHWLAWPLVVLTLGLPVCVGATGLVPSMDLPVAILGALGLQLMVGLAVLQWVWTRAPGASRWRRVVLLFPLSVFALIGLGLISRLTGG